MSNNISYKISLFKRISEGDKKAFDIFFESYYLKLVQFAQIFVESEQHAEDIVSEVLTNILINRKRIFVLENFDAYLYSSVKNKALSLAKKRKVADDYSKHLSNTQQGKFSFVDPHDLLEEKEFKNLLVNVINGLPPKRKMVFQLIREEGFTYCQVAELLDISDRTVEVHLKLAVKSLRKKIKEYLLHDIINLVEN